MRNLNIAIRSLFKKGRHNVMKIISLSVVVCCVGHDCEDLF